MDTHSIDPRSPYLIVYDVLEKVAFAPAVPPGAFGAIHSAIDLLRDDGAPQEHVAAAQGISLALHRLEWSMRRREDAEQEAARTDLQALGAGWLQMPIGFN